MSEQPKSIIVFTGAGISAESGIKTFRDNDGLWENFKVEDVATPHGFEKNPQLVWDFYRQRHNQLSDVFPNEAHYALAKLEDKLTDLGYNFILLTQNVDRLHQRGGSKNIHEIHGNLHDVKCSHCDYVETTQTYWKNDVIPNCPKCNKLLRPSIVWFGEVPDQDAYHTVADNIKNCVAMAVIGTSCQVQPVAGLIHAANLQGAEVFECNLEKALIPRFDESYHPYIGKATKSVPRLCDDMIKFARR